jgi:hypothetical protein
LRHCATNRKVAGSIPDDVTGFFLLTYHSVRTVALGSTQPLTEMNARNISYGVKAADAWGCQPCHLYVPIVLKSGSLILLEPSGPVNACNGIALFFTYTGLGSRASLEGCTRIPHCNPWTVKPEVSHCTNCTILANQLHFAEC